MNPNTLILIGLIGAALFFIGPTIWKWGAAKLTPSQKSLPPTDAERIEMLMQMRDKDDVRFSRPESKKALNHVIQCLTGTLDTDPVPPVPTPEPIV